MYLDSELTVYTVVTLKFWVSVSSFLDLFKVFGHIHISAKAGPNCICFFFVLFDSCENMLYSNIEQSIQWKFSKKIGQVCRKKYFYRLLQTNYYNVSNLIQFLPNTAFPWVNTESLAHLWNMGVYSGKYGILGSNQLSQLHWQSFTFDVDL